MYSVCTVQTGKLESQNLVRHYRLWSCCCLQAEPHPQAAFSLPVTSVRPHLGICHMAPLCSSWTGKDCYRVKNHAGLQAPQESVSCPCGRRILGCRHMGGGQRHSSPSVTQQLGCPQPWPPRRMDQMNCRLMFLALKAVSTASRAPCCHCPGGPDTGPSSRGDLVPRATGFQAVL